MDEKASHLSTHGNQQEGYPIPFFQDCLFATRYFMKLTMDKTDMIIPKIQMKTGMNSIGFYEVQQLEPPARSLIMRWG